MRILFLYAKFDSPYHGFHKFEINFSRDRHFSVNEDGELTDEPASVPIPEDFWDEGKQIYNVSALVGRNAAGKTTILQYLTCLLSKFVSSDPHTPALLPTNHKGSLVFQDSDVLYQADYGVDNHYQWTCSLINYKTNEPVDLPISSIFARLKPIYLSNTLTMSDYILARELRRFDGKEPADREAYVYNASQVAWLMKNYSSNRYTRLDSFASYTFEEQYRQIKFVFNPSPTSILRKLRNQSVPVPCAEYVTVGFLNYTSSSFPFNHAQLIKFFPTACRELQQMPSSDPDYLHKALIFQFCQFAIMNLIICASRTPYGRGVTERFPRYEDLFKDLENSFDEERSKGFVHSNDDYERLIVLIHNCWLQKDLSSREYFEVLEDFERSTRGFICFLHSSNPGFSDLRPFIYDIRSSCDGEIPFIAEFKVKTGSLSLESSTPFLLFLRCYRLLPGSLNFLNFSWGLSSGENTLLSIFSNLYHLSEYYTPNIPNASCQIQNKTPTGLAFCDSILLLIDEADLTLHPEWQRKFLYSLTAFLPKLYPDIKDIQIVLTTHSPLMLGDIPSQCVTYLSKGENGEIISDASGTRFTFGQNIYLLLKDSFYLEDSALGPIAQRKLQAVIEKLKTIPEKPVNLIEEAIRTHLNILDKIQHETVDLLAPGIIKSKLKEEIERRRVILQALLPAEPIDYTQLSLEELKRQQAAITEAIEKREASRK